MYAQIDYKLSIVLGRGSWKWGGVVVPNITAHRSVRSHIPNYLRTYNVISSNVGTVSHTVTDFSIFIGKQSNSNLLCANEMSIRAENNFKAFDRHHTHLHNYHNYIL